MKANCSAAVQSKKVWYVESCLERESKGKASFQLAHAFQETILSEETVGSVVPLEGESLVQYLQVSISKLSTVRTVVPCSVKAWRRGGVCITRNRTWLYRLPQSQKQCIYLVRRTAICMEHEKISSSAPGQLDDPSRVSS